MSVIISADTLLSPHPEKYIVFIKIIRQAPAYVILAGKAIVNYNKENTNVQLQNTAHLLRLYTKSLGAIKGRFHKG
jgi:hypothetical protein